MKYLYDDALFSDFYKEAHGFRPAGILMEVWNGLNPVQKQARWDELGRIVEENCRNTRKMEEGDLQRALKKVSFLSTHPPTEDRIEFLNKLSLENVAPKDDNIVTIDFKEFQERLRNQIE